MVLRPGGGLHAELVPSKEATPVDAATEVVATAVLVVPRAARVGATGRDLPRAAALAAAQVT